MDEIRTAEDAVFVKSEEVDESTLKVRGYDFNAGINYEKLFDSYLTTGFQASHLALAIEVGGSIFKVVLV